MKYLELMDHEMKLIPDTYHADTEPCKCERQDYFFDGEIGNLVKIWFCLDCGEQGIEHE